MYAYTTEYTQRHVGHTEYLIIIPVPYLHRNFKESVFHFDIVI